MKSTLMAAAALTAFAGAAQAQFVFLGNFGGHDYWHTPNNTYTQAEGRLLASLFAPTAYLVAINTAAEQAFLNGALGTAPTGAVHWLGLSGGGTGQASFNTWDSGEAVTYTNWGGDAEFNNPAKVSSTFNWTPTGQWLNLGPNGEPFGRKRIVVEVVPTPGAAMIAGLGGLALLRRKR